MVTPGLSGPLGSRLSLPQYRRWEHHSLECFALPEAVTFVSLLFDPEYVVSSKGFLSSDVPDSELQASVSQMLDVEKLVVGIVVTACVHPQAVVGRGLSGVIKTRHCDLQLFLLACQTQQLCLRETPQVVSALKRFWCSLRKMSVFNDPFCFQLWSEHSRR